ncbi:Helix-turn-helix domain-containing protein [Pedobacter sp. ok626]|uniref:helix-turn-helix domain-containing protein n=1 Tax=Pedobacter sp. ok626 TaxID=1761882 RepID=UPI0008834E26|nr:helix-turn-helix domain-containing protein [Pedobacter sp. ok626]SDL75955.1 Helix-turn-helix domain-containing protein [Pedobacter sp. ok626]
MEDLANMGIFTPHQALQPYVQSYCYMGPGVIKDHFSALSIYPVDYTQMSFVLDEYHEFREIGIEEISSYPLCFVGLLDQGRSFDRFPKSVVQVLFKPYGAFKLFGIPQRYLCNQGTDMRLLFPEASSLAEQLRAAAHSPVEAIVLLEKWLLNRLPLTAKVNVDVVAYACQQIQDSKGVVRIDELSRSMRISTTTLGDQFREKIGLSPKTFSRIVRFNDINNFISRNQNVSWQELVYKFGFFDQNHFIKEFKRFYGCTPSEWHRR